jgi:hypothetical protein
MKKGPLFEKQGVDYLNASFDTDTIERRVMGGANDRGDVAGVYFGGKPFVVEFKNVKTLRPKQYFAELEAECGNADTDMGAVVFHRPKVGEKSMGEQGVFMTLRTLCRLLGAEVGE